MVFIRRKGALEWDHPNYDHKSKYFTLVMHFGEKFVNMPLTEYVGGEKLAYDWIKADEVKIGDLEKFSSDAGVKGDKRFYIKLRNGGFKYCVDDDDLRTWASKYLPFREIQIFVELSHFNEFEKIPIDVDYESFEDDEFVIGNEVASDDDDEMFESNISTDIVEVPVTDGVGIESGSDEHELGKDMIDGDAYDFDEFRVSDEDNNDPNYHVFNPKTTFNPEFELKQIFAPKKEFKMAAKSHAIKARRSIHFPKNDLRRIYAKCCDVTCKWMIHALRIKNEFSYQIRKINLNHTCAPEHKVRSLSSTWLCERFLQRFQSDGNRKVSVFMEDASYDIRCEVTRQQAYRAKSLALLRIDGDPNAQYAKLWSYAEEIRKTNPGTSMIIGTENDNGVARFSKAYVCFDALKKGFREGCRQIIGVDGCHLKSKYGGVLLSGVGVDGNNNLYPVAYVVVDKENKDIWEWFLTVLKQDLNIKTDEFTFMSDKQKGLIQAMQSVFPGVNHKFCVRHMHNNLKNAGFRGQAFKQTMWKAACSTTHGEFNCRMAELKALNEGAWAWFSDKPGEQWSKAFFSEKSKCDMLLNNVCEFFNSAILEARGKAIITLLEWIREYLMKRLQKNRERAARWKGRLCPRICKILEKNMEEVNDCILIKSSDKYYQVSCFDGGQYTINLEQGVCSCRLWQLTGIPCKHGVCVILKQKLDPIDFVHEFYTIETYKKAYEEPILGISYDALWGDTLYIPPLPPNFGTRPKRGRKVTKRRMGAEEHNSTTCKSNEAGGQSGVAAGSQSGVAIGSQSGVAAGSKRGVAAGSKSGVAAGSQSGVAASSQTGVASSEQVSTNRAIRKKLAPPSVPPVTPNADEGGISDVATQESHITTKSWLGPTPTPCMQGPSMDQQLRMGNTNLQPMVQMRAPPPFTSGHFVNMSLLTLQPETLKKIFVDEGGHKFMELSSQTIDNGKKKVN